jgi:hypothetical protein
MLSGGLSNVGDEGLTVFHAYAMWTGIEMKRTDLCNTEIYAAYVYYLKA